METIPKADCQNIGFIRKTHGVKGEVVLEFEPVFDETLEEIDKVFIELDGLLVPFFINNNGLRFKSATSAIIGFNWVKTEKYASRLVGNKVFVFKSEIIQKTNENQETQFIGYVLYDTQKGEIGEVVHVDNYSGNIVLTVDFNNNELLIPFNPNLLVTVNEKQKTVEMNLPEGLLNQD